MPALAITPEELAADKARTSALNREARAEALRHQRRARADADAEYRRRLDRYAESASEVDDAQADYAERRRAYAAALARWRAQTDAWPR